MPCLLERGIDLPLGETRAIRRRHTDHLVVGGLEAYVHVLGQRRGSGGLIDVDEIAWVVDGHRSGGPGGGFAGVYKLSVAGGLVSENCLVGSRSCGREISSVADVVKGSDGRVVGVEGASGVGQ